MEQPIIVGNTVQHGTDKGLIVHFYNEAIEDEEKSKEYGRPIYKDMDFISIRIVGDNKTDVRRPVRLYWDANNAPDNERWPQKYEAFKRSQEQVEQGTPITEWPPISKAVAMNLKGFNIHTVEALTQVSDANLYSLGMGARELREKARAFIEEAEKGSGLMRLQAENEDLRGQVQAMKEQMAAFSKMMEDNKKAPEMAMPAVVLNPSTEAYTPPAEPINFTPATSSYGKRGRPPKNQSQEN